MAETGIPRNWLSTLLHGEAHWLVLLRFLAIGGFFSLVMVLLALLFASGLGLKAQVAQGLAHALCIVPTYLCQRAITFRSNVAHSRGLLGYALMQLPLLALGAGAAWLLIEQWHWPHAPALVLIAGGVAFTSFMAQRLLVFAAGK